MFIDTEQAMYSYYILDGTKKRVTFDGEDEGAKNETILPTDTEEIVENGDDSTAIDNEDQEDIEEEEADDTVRIIYCLKDQISLYVLDKR